VKKLSLVTVLSLATIVLVSTLSPVALAQGPDVYHFNCYDIGLTLDAYHPNVTVTIWGEFKDTYLTVPVSYFVVGALVYWFGERRVSRCLDPVHRWVQR
jgi:hypothetical protein